MKNQNLNIALRVNNLGDWVKSYKVFDHLGTLRVEGICVGHDMQSYYDYKPFGGLEFSENCESNLSSAIYIFKLAKTRLGEQETPRLSLSKLKKSTPLNFALQNFLKKVRGEFKEIFNIL